MLRTFLISVFILPGLLLSGQITEDKQNSAERLLESENKISIGGYGQIDYNQPFGKGVSELGELDVHRLVLLFAYRFDDRTNFITEIEFEHVKEVYVEQAFLQYRINNQLNFRGGLMLIPMGLINELHEPPSFNGVERPLVDKYISPTTWREIGMGFSGNLHKLSVKYQLYLVNGFNGYDGESRLGGSNGLRKGRQKGAESFISSPNITFRTEYYGIRGLSLGLSGYFGNTQSTLADGLDRNNRTAVAAYDSSRVGINMIGVDAKYSYKGIQVKAQYYLNKLTNTADYNTFTATGGENNDLGSKMMGYYIEAGYDIFSSAPSINTGLIPFIRYEEYNTHHDVEGMLNINNSYKKRIITAGLTAKLSPGAVLKTDIQWLKDGSPASGNKIFNAGIGVMF